MVDLILDLLGNIEFRHKDKIGKNGFKLILREDGSGVIRVVGTDEILYDFDTLSELIYLYGPKFARINTESEFGE